MAINVLHYRHDGRDSWGVARHGAILPLGEFATTGDFLRQGAGRARELAETGGAGGPREDQVEILSPVTQNQQFVCQAINYRDHMIESGIDPDHQPYNVFFRKASSCIAPPHTDVVRPAHVTLLDYEIELGLVIGCELRGERSIATGDLHEVVAALVIVNDVSARDVQLPQGQFYKGKSYRTFGPVGPYLTLVDRADLARLEQLHLRLWVNDEVRQDSYASGLVFKPAPTLSEMSGLQDLFPGDLIATGTPSGCAVRAPNKAVMMISNLLPPQVRWRAFLRAGASNPRYLKPGDRMRASIRTDDGAIDLGEQRNLIVQA
jgi:2,4-didehydro-3-deoxy-L-rhamnonate hydrolase